MKSATKNVYSFLVFSKMNHCFSSTGRNPRLYLGKFCNQCFTFRLISVDESRIKMYVEDVAPISVFFSRLHQTSAMKHIHKDEQKAFGFMCSKIKICFDIYQAKHVEFIFSVFNFFLRYFHFLQMKLLFCYQNSLKTLMPLQRLN